MSLGFLTLIFFFARVVCLRGMSEHRLDVLLNVAGKLCFVEMGNEHHLQAVPIPSIN